MNPAGATEGLQAPALDALDRIKDGNGSPLGARTQRGSERVVVVALRVLSPPWPALERCSGY
jgi:hypothetical protein